jgi:hypothetical protein
VSQLIQIGTAPEKPTGRCSPEDPPLFAECLKSHVNQRPHVTTHSLAATYQLPPATLAVESRQHLQHQFQQVDPNPHIDNTVFTASLIRQPTAPCSVHQDSF